jgi:hypothetical protein
VIGYDPIGDAEFAVVEQVGCVVRDDSSSPFDKPVIVGVGAIDRVQCPVEPRLVHAVKATGRGAHRVARSRRGFYPRVPLPFADSLTPEQIGAVVEFTRTGLG